MAEAHGIATQRRVVVQEALSWLWTPFHWHSQVKGPTGGCDCGALLKASYDRVGTNVELPKYTTQFFLHGTEEVYLKALARYCYVGHKFEPQGWTRRPCPAHTGRFQLECVDCLRMPSEVYPPECKRCGLDANEHLEDYQEQHPPAGDIVVFKMGKAYGHGGVIVDWPLIVHSSARDSFVAKVHVNSHPELLGRDRLFFSIKAWHPEHK